MTLAFDLNGNIALQVQPFLGGITTNDIPSASFVSTTTIAFIPDYTVLENNGTSIGGSFFSPYYGLGGGLDINLYPYDNDNHVFWGFTSSAGIGTPSGEFHVNWGDTYTLFNINIFQAIEDLFSH